MTDIFLQTDSGDFRKISSEVSRSLRSFTDVQADIAKRLTDSTLTLTNASIDSTGHLKCPSAGVDTLSSLNLACHGPALVGGTTTLNDNVLIAAGKDLRLALDPSQPGVSRGSVFCHNVNADGQVYCSTLTSTGPAGATTQGMIPAMTLVKNNGSPASVHVLSCEGNMSCAEIDCSGVTATGKAHFRGTNTSDGVYCGPDTTQTSTSHLNDTFAYVPLTCENTSDGVPAVVVRSSTPAPSAAAPEATCMDPPRKMTAMAFSVLGKNNPQNYFTGDAQLNVIFGPGSANQTDTAFEFKTTRHNGGHGVMTLDKNGHLETNGNITTPSTVYAQNIDVSGNVSVTGTLTCPNLTSNGSFTAGTAPASGSGPTPLTYYTGSGSQAWLGYSVAVSNDKIVFSEPHATGDHSWSGKVHIKRYDTTTGLLVDVGSPISGEANNERIGTSVAIWDDPDSSLVRVAIGSTHVSPGSLKVYDYVNGNWQKVFSVTGGVNEINEGFSVAVWGTMAATIGSNYLPAGDVEERGRCRVYKKNPSTNQWSQTGSDIVGSNGVEWWNRYLDSVAITENWLFVADVSKSGYQGVVMVYQYDTSVYDWQLHSTLTPQGGGGYLSAYKEFGRHVSAYEGPDFVRLAVGVPYTDNTDVKPPGTCEVWEWDPSNTSAGWQRQWIVAGDYDDDHFGQSVGIYEDKLVVGSESNYAKIFTLASGGAVSQIGPTITGNGYVGHETIDTSTPVNEQEFRGDAVAISADYVVIGDYRSPLNGGVAPRELGKVYIYSTASNVVATTVNLWTNTLGLPIVEPVTPATGSVYYKEDNGTCYLYVYGSDGNWKRVALNAVP